MKTLVLLLMLGIAAVAPNGCDKSVPAAPKTLWTGSFAAAAPMDPASDPPYAPPLPQAPPSAPLPPASTPR